MPRRHSNSAALVISRTRGCVVSARAMPARNAPTITDTPCTQRPPTAEQQAQASANAILHADSS